MRCFVVPDGGSSSTQTSYAQILAIHAALLSNGTIVYFSGEQHDPGQFAQGQFDHARIFDCTSFTVSSCQPAPGISDLFCCGHAFLSSDQLLIAGGTKRFDGFQGELKAWIFDARTSSFTAVSSMSDGRWYPTLLTLGNGGVLAVSGLNAAGSDQNRNLDVFGPGGAWTSEGVLSYALETLYPRVHLLPNGVVFFVSPMNGQCMTWHPGTAAPVGLCSSPFGGMGFSQYSSVLLPLLPEQQYAPRVLVTNTQQPQVIDLSVASPVWSNTGVRSLAGGLSTPPQRFNGTLTLLPTGEALSAGGEEQYGDEAHPVLALEVYRPATNSWVALPVSTAVTRAYHSVALLMPDGRVWFAGSNKRCDWSFHNSGDFRGQPQPTTLQEVSSSGAVDNRELRIEIFEPWYFSRSDRPTLTANASSIAVGGTLTLTSPQAALLSRVALLRAGSCTHAFNADQRYVGLPFVVSGNTITATIPDNENIVPPGPYLVFVLAQVMDPSGATLDVPSIGIPVEVVNTKLVKELKFEVEVAKLEIEREVIKTVSEVIDPGDRYRGDPAWLLQRLAVAVDNIARNTVAVRSFIRPEERPHLAQISRSQLASVPIHPIDQAMLQRQIAMEGMPAQMPAGMPGMPAAGMPTTTIHVDKAPSTSPAKGPHGGSGRKR